MEDITLDALIGENVAKLRQQADLSQADLARAMTHAGWTWHQQTVLKVEKGHRPLRLAEAVTLARLLDVDPSVIWTPGADEVALFRAALRNLELAANDLQESTWGYEEARHVLLALCQFDDREPSRHAPEAIREDVRRALETDPAGIVRSTSPRARRSHLRDPSIDPREYVFQRRPWPRSVEE